MLSSLNKILCYPKFNEEEFKRRLEEIHNLGITEILSEGKVKIDDFRILGKGTNSLVVKAIYKGNFVALKIRRTDATRNTLENEAKILKRVNEYNIGPKLFDFSQNFLVLEYIEGKFLEEFIMENDLNQIKNVLLKLLIQCRILDLIKVDHGELSRASKHVIVTKDHNVKIIDFETASQERKPNNLTSIISYLFLRPDDPLKLRENLKVNFNDLKFLLKSFKKDYSEETFYQILSKLNIY
jgi:putative serine/threonine protein kinase